MAIWILGYGSLTWRPNFEYRNRAHGYIKGWKRVWWQGSTDHRGTPEKPGRTVTLHEDHAAITWGVAYELAGTDEQQQATLRYLEVREKQYDIRLRLDLFALGPRPDREPLCASVGGASSMQREPRPEEQTEHVVVPGCLVYIGSQDKSRNPNFLGPAPLSEIAQQIASSHGPSGPNCDYLFGLARAMRELGVEDKELFDLEQRVKNIQAVKACEHGNGLDN